MSQRRSHIDIRGMSCANCSQTVADSVTRLDGVSEATVNFATDEAQVSFNPAETSRGDLYDAIEASGYTPVREDDESRTGKSSVDRREAARSAEIRKQFRLTVFGAALSVPLLFFLVEKLLLGGGRVASDGVRRRVRLDRVRLATPVQLVLGWPFYRNSYNALVKNRTANMDVLIALGSSTAYLYSVVVLLGLLASEGLYFDTAALILVFITLGNYLEARSKGQASEALRALLEMEADTATVVDDDGTEREIPVEEVDVGDRMKVRPGEQIPTDGVAFDEGDHTLADGGTPAADGETVVADERLDEDEVLRLAASAERASEHPLARAIVEAATERGLTLSDSEAFENVPGQGVRATVEGDVILVGNRTLLRSHGVDPTPATGTMERLENEGKTAMLVARLSEGGASADDAAPKDATGGTLLGVVANADTVKDSAREAVAGLTKRGVDVMMLTGDNGRTARAVAERVGIAPDAVHAEVLPADKSSTVEDIQHEGRKVMMVGDGVNDAPALAVAYVGCAIGSGTDVAIEAADVTLMRDDPLDVVKAIRISDGTLAKIKQNLFWALGYNTAMIPLASLGLLQPVLAAVAMAFSSVSVLANSLLFRRYIPDHDYTLLGFLRR
ncbi:MAG: heavy metal translocating P-type ATPase [Halobacteriota archaeon]